MRALLAAALALALVLTAVAPHAHAGLHGADDCPACVVRGAEAPAGQIPEVARPLAATGEVELAPVLTPPTGAPLGAVPGQSPPRA